MRAFFVFVFLGLLCNAFSMDNHPNTDTSGKASLDYCQKLRDMITASEWCRVTYKGDVFVVRTKALDGPLGTLLGNEPGDLKKANEPVKHCPHEFVTFYDKNGKIKGEIGFWKLPNLPLHLIRLDKFEHCIIVRVDPMQFFEESKSVLFSFENNIEAIASSDLRHTAFEVIVQERFKNHWKKSHQIIEPFLKDNDRDDYTRYSAAYSMLKIDPNHVDARRVYRELRLKFFGVR